MSPEANVTKRDKDLGMVLSELVVFVGLILKALYWTVGDAVRIFLPRTPKSVTGRVVLVTGASRGLGRQIALQFAARGATVVLWSSKKANVSRVMDEITRSGGRSVCYECDVSDEGQVQEVSHRVLQDLGHVDILVNNAGVVQLMPVVTCHAKEVRRIYNVNLLAHYWTIRAFLPKMIERGKGHVVAINSICSFINGPGGSAYCGAKHGMLALMDCVEQETDPKHNINFTTVCPGFFEDGLVTNIRNRVGVMFPVSTAEQIAKDTINAILVNKRHVVLPTRIWIFAKLGLFILSKRALNLLQNYINYEVDVVER